MTISAAWVRRVNEHEELVVACDSKLTGGEEWEGCPKLFTFERDDCVLAFAGATFYAYPAAIQLVTALSSYKRIRDRATDIVDVRNHVLNILNGMLYRRECPDHPGARFIFGGYSWRARAFRLWTIKYEPDERRFCSSAVQERRGGAIAILGDPVEAEKEMRERLRMRFFTKRTGEVPFDWEPLAALRDIIRERAFPAVGGPPQVAKVYAYSKSQIFSVYWRDRGDEGLTLRGRYALEYELPDNTVLDADTYEFFSARGHHHLARCQRHLIGLLDARARDLEARGP